MDERMNGWTNVRTDGNLHAYVFLLKQVRQKLKINHCFIDTEDKLNMKMAKHNTCDSIMKDKILQVNKVLTKKFKTCLRDSLFDTIWRPRMKNMRTGIKI